MKINGALLVDVLVIVSATAIAIVRPFVTTHGVSLTGSYEAMAHIVVGIMLGGYWYGKHRWLLGGALGLTSVELSCAIGPLFFKP